MKSPGPARSAPLKYSIPPRARVPSHHNVGTWDRVAAAVAGALLAAVAIRQRRWHSVPLLIGGAEFLRRAATGHCFVYSTLGISTAGLSPQHASKFYDDQMTGRLGPAPYHVQRSITIGAPRADVYAHFENLSELFLDVPAIKRVEQSAQQLDIWFAPDGGTPVALRFEFDVREPGRELAWRCRADHQDRAEGVLVFTDAPDDWGTEVTVAYRRTEPGPKYFGGALGVVSDADDRLVRKYLRAVKQVIETGHMATAELRPAIEAAERRPPPLLGDMANPQFSDTVRH